ncbi:glycosyltransferase family 2 protein [Actinokineospora fastidiosa]|uniref:Glycosyltransferase 2-like domain-containing protein n=1 Tax=Actinokineospora fastidiosa TaxID=1816 RepID=A0A918GLW6_9PSEU|nr:glycosyltransferase family 2 protein [Actinokineospora fastidiosa]GGS47268.1 hypothetical protein GCM10010171_48130 [Actinokineospora fastidiosa]
MKVSVIVPNYNYARPLEECLRAALAQTYPDTEVVVVDDCSTDDSPRVAESFGVRVVRTPRNVGAPAARNHGAEHTDGDVVMFVDSDVALAPDAVAQAVAALRADDSVGAVCGIYDPDPMFVDSLAEQYRGLQLHYWQKEDEGHITTSYTAILAVRREVFTALGGFHPTMRHTDNAEFGARLSLNHRILLTSAVRGRHDFDDNLRMVLRKMFTRARLTIPIYLRRPELNGGLSGGPRAYASLITLAALATVPLPLLFGPALAAVPAGALAVALVCDRGLFRFVRRHRGPVFLGYFMGVHMIVNATVAAAAVAGGAQWVLSRRFRRMYDGMPGWA